MQILGDNGGTEGSRAVNGVPLARHSEELAAADQSLQEQIAQREEVEEAIIETDRPFFGFL